MKCYRCNAWPCDCKDGITLIHGDCREVLPLDVPYSLVITDPPYRTLDVEVSTGTTTRLVSRDQFSGKRLADGPVWFPTIDDSDIQKVICCVSAVMPSSGAAYVFSDVKTGLSLFPGLHVRNVIVWDKLKIGMGYGWRRMHEWIGYIPMSQHKLRYMDLGDIIRCEGVTNKQHPTEKPLGVLGKLIVNSSDVGDTIFDPFCGSGSTLIAAKKLGRRAIGIEIEEHYCEIAANRLRQEFLQFTELSP